MKRRRLRTCIAGIAGVGMLFFWAMEPIISVCILMTCSLCAMVGLRPEFAVVVVNHLLRAGLHFVVL